MAVNKKDLTEAEIRTRFITPAIKDITGWDVNNIRDEFPIDAGQSYPSGPKGKRGKKRFADYVLAAQILGWAVQGKLAELALAQPGSMTQHPLSLADCNRRSQSAGKGEAGG